MTGFDVIIAGAGVIGTSIAYHVAKSGGTVALIDGAGPAEPPSASWASAGGLRTQGRSSAERALSLRAADRWRDLEAELEADLEIAFGGHLHLAETQAQAMAVERRIQTDQKAGLAMERVEPAAIAEIAPLLTKQAVLGAFTPDDGQAHPGRTTRAFAAAARRLGARLHFGQRARITQKSRRVTGLLLENGETLCADKTVLATGAWTNDMLAPIGFSLPLRARGLQMQLSDLAPQGSLGPTVTAQGRNLSLKQTRSGAYMLGGQWFCQPTGRGLATEPIPAHLSGQWGEAAAILPSFDQRQPAHIWAGTEAQSIDSMPFIGHLPIPGLYSAVGFSNHGFQISPSVGELVAEALRADRPPLLAPFEPARASGVEPAQLAQFREQPLTRGM